jgi:hypothetical protein
MFIILKQHSCCCAPPLTPGPHQHGMSKMISTLISGHRYGSYLINLPHLATERTTRSIICRMGPRCPVVFRRLSSGWARKLVEIRAAPLGCCSFNLTTLKVGVLAYTTHNNMQYRSLYAVVPALTMAARINKPQWNSDEINDKKIDGRCG